MDHGARGRRSDTAGAAGSRDEPPLRDYLTMAQAAALLGLHPATLGQQARAGKLRAARLGRFYVTTAAWLDAYRARYGGQRGRTEGGDAQERYNRRFTALLALGRRKTPEAILHASVGAGVDTLWKYPDTTPDGLREIVDAHRRTLLRRESDAERAADVAAIMDAVLASPGIDAARYAAARTAARRAPSALGVRWLELFQAAVAAADEELTPRNLGAIARLDQRVAQALAEELLGAEPRLHAHECRAKLVQAMLEGSMNLPPDSGDCREMIEHTVERGMRLAIGALRRRRTASDDPAAFRNGALGDGGTMRGG